MARGNSRWGVRGVALLMGAFASGVVGEDILKTVGFTNCNSKAKITVQKVDINYNNDQRIVTFDVVGTSDETQNVTAVLSVKAYGRDIYSNTFDPCKNNPHVAELCPVDKGTFTARGSQTISEAAASQVPGIAFQVPDIAAMATLQLKSSDGEDVACVQSTVTNGKTADVPAVSYIAGGIAGMALMASGVSAIGSAMSGAGAGGGSGAGGAGTISPSFTETFGWFQGMAVNGMLSVNYPQVYSKFAKNFAFSTGLVPWTGLQLDIDSFRAATGGNLTRDGVEFLRKATFVYPDNTTSTSEERASTKVKRAFEQFALLAARDAEASTGSTGESATTSGTESLTESVRVAVSGIKGYVQELSVPQSNTFMTVLLIVAIVIAAIAVGILLVKVILEIWALFGSFPKSLTGFRKHYWGSIARAITSLILLLYGMWVLYCIFQFTEGDSWAAKTLAGVTLVLFTAVLGFFSYKIWSTARKLEQMEGNASALYENKSIWVKYSLFYESYKKDYWWIFVPTLVYMFAKGCTVAALDGKGMAQTVTLLIVESLMMVLLLWNRPFERKSSNVINIIIQIVRVLSVVCILVFVEELGVSQTTSTVTGVVLIAIQSALTGLLAILIAWNAINACCKANPHRKRRKDIEKMQRDLDTLTPLDARNSLLLERTKGGAGSDTFSIANTVPEKQSARSLSRDSSPSRYSDIDGSKKYPGITISMDPYRPLTPSNPAERERQSLVEAAAPISGTDRDQTLPASEYGHATGHPQYSQPSHGGGYGSQWMPSSKKGY